MLNQHTSPEILMTRIDQLETKVDTLKRLHDAVVDERDELRTKLAELDGQEPVAIADARREGAEQMREAAASAGFDAAFSDENACEVMKAICALPLPTGPRQAVRLTYEQRESATSLVRDAILDHIYEYGIASEGLWVLFRRLARAIENAVLAANGIGDSNA